MYYYNSETPRQIGHKMLLRPTEAELEEARALDIDPKDLNGPQLREKLEIARNRLKLQGVNAPQALLKAASEIGIVPGPNDTKESFERRIEEQIERLFRERGFNPQTTVLFHRHKTYSGQLGKIVSLDIRWDKNVWPSVAVYFDGRPKTQYISAFIVIRCAEAVR